MKKTMGAIRPAPYFISNAIVTNISVRYPQVRDSTVIPKK
jgi:hypothetical protein